MDFQDLNALRSIDELQSYQTEVRDRISELNTEYTGLPFPDEEREEYAELRSVDEEIGARLVELRAREEHAASLARSDSHTERPNVAFTPRGDGARGDDIYDLSTVPRNLSDPTVEGRVLRDRALRVVETARFAHVEREVAQTHVDHLLAGDTDDGRIARYIVATGSPMYDRAFGKYLKGQQLTREEQSAMERVQLAARAMSLTGSAGGFAVPFTLDPTIIPTSNSSVNPFRAIARVEQITVDEWRGVSSGAISAAYAAEATEASDNAPTLAQPTISTEKAQAFIPFSIEVGQDWNGLQGEMARLLQDSKDDLEATKFAVGSGTNEPQGVITGATTTSAAAGTAAFVIGDLDTLEADLPARFRPRASMVMNRFVAQKVRHFDTGGGSSVWNQGVQLQQGLQTQAPTPGRLGVTVLGYPAYEASAMAATLTTGSKIAILGDFNYYVIVDRIGLSVEVIPHLFGTNRRPTGQRGLYAYWRNGAGVVSAGAFRVLVTG